MQLGTKAQIAKTTLSLLTLMTSLFLLGVLVLVLCVGLQIDPFRETTTSFLGALFAGLIGVAAILVLLNVATNISLIADAKIAELKIDPHRGVLRKWTVTFFVVAAALVCLIFVGTYLSKERYLGVVRAQADEVLKANNGLLEETSRLLASGKPEDYKRIIEIRKFLQSQRSDLPELTVIYSGKFAGKLAFTELKISAGTSKTISMLRPITSARRIWIATTLLDSSRARRPTSCRNTRSATTSFTSTSRLLARMRVLSCCSPARIAMEKLVRD